MAGITWDEWRGSLDGRPTMWIKRLASFRGMRLDLHKMVDVDDPGCYHTHPATAVRVILWGGYAEQLESGDTAFWLPGDVGIVRPALAHRVAALNGAVSYSLWLRFRKTAGVELHGSGWPSARRIDENGDEWIASEPAEKRL